MGQACTAEQNSKNEQHSFEGPHWPWLKLLKETGVAFQQCVEGDKGTLDPKQSCDVHRCNMG